MASENQKIWKTLSLSKSFENMNTEKGKQLTANYLPMLFYLRDLYEKQNKKNEIPPIDKAIDKIGIQTNKLKQIQTILGK
jgi:sulfur relay (sulfurtransferase) DsrC/TusE family protein